VLLLIHSDIVDADATLRAFTAAGLQADVFARYPGPLGRLMSERAELLEARGLLRPGQRDEEVLVLRGTLGSGPRPEAEAEARGRRRAAHFDLVR
jgi:release factor glutamine methyltransferase